MGAAGLKSFAVTVLILGLVVEQAQAIDVCCPKETQAYFDKCYADGGVLFLPLCMLTYNCRQGKCPSTSDISHQSLYLDSTDVAAANVAPVEFCKSGCTSSVCDSLKTAVVGKVVDQAEDVVVNRCAQACSSFCTKHLVDGNVATKVV